MFDDEDLRVVVQAIEETADIYEARASDSVESAPGAAHEWKHDAKRLRDIHARMAKLAFDLDKSGVETKEWTFKLPLTASVKVPPGETLLTDTLRTFQSGVVDIRSAFAHGANEEVQVDSHPIGRAVANSRPLGDGFHIVSVRLYGDVPSELVEPVTIDSNWLLAFLEHKTRKMVEVARRKNADYAGASSDPFGNFRHVEDLGIASTGQGFLTRMTDKLCRVATFEKRGALQVADETVEDTLVDLANYSLLLAAWYASQRLSAEGRTLP